MAEKENPSTFSETEANFQPLVSFLKQTGDGIEKSLQTADEDSRQFLEHCKTKCSSLLQSLPVQEHSIQDVQEQNIQPDTLQGILRNAAHLILEYTYLDETLMVDDEFPPDVAVSRIAQVQEQLDRINRVASECFPSKPVLETLGVELVECVHWRQGALLYMYCHTVENNSRREDPAYYKLCLEQGVRYLEKMLSTRQPTHIPDTVGPDDSLQLFQQGVFSDTHLLAIMYAAEMCYWHQQAVDKKMFAPDPGDSTSGTGDGTFSACQLGIQYLNTYLAAVKGPLKNQEWNSSRAEELLQYFNKSH